MFFGNWNSFWKNRTKSKPMNWSVTSTPISEKDYEKIFHTEEKLIIAQEALYIIASGVGDPVKIAKEALKDMNSEEDYD